MVEVFPEVLASIGRNTESQRFDYTNDLSRMDSKPADGKRIIFRSRLWDAGERHPEWKRLKGRHLNDRGWKSTENETKIRI